MREAAVDISIIDDTSRRGCNAACGTDWSSPEAVELAHRQVKNRFGGETRLKYLDLSLTIPDDEAAQWHQAIRGRNLSVPLLLVNGQLRVAGQFDIRQIMDAVEAETEIGI